MGTQMDHRLTDAKGCTCSDADVLFIFNFKICVGSLFELGIRYSSKPSGPCNSSDIVPSL